MGRKPRPAEVRVKFFLASPSRGDAEAGRSRRGGHLPLAGHYWLAQSGGVRSTGDPAAPGVAAVTRGAERGCAGRTDHEHGAYPRAPDRGARSLVERHSRYLLVLALTDAKKAQPSRR